MSDVGEPPMKMSKYEEYLEETDAESECYDEGQEEWLSDDMLADDDYHIEEKDKTVSDLGDYEQDNMLSIQETEGADQTGTEKVEENIESTLNSLDKKNDIPEKLLTKKTDDSEQNDNKIMINNDVQKEEEDDGNDTDDLLRLLQDDQQNKKKTLKLVKTEKTQNHDTSDDEEQISDRSKAKTLKLAKNVSNKLPRKAVPEDMSDSDLTDAESSEDGDTLRQMFGLKNNASNSKNISSKNDNTKKIVKHVVQVNSNQSNGKLTQPNKKCTVVINNPKTDTRPFKTIEMRTSTPYKQAEKNISKVQKPAVQTEIKKVIQKPAVVQTEIKKVIQKPAVVQTEIKKVVQKPAVVQTKIKKDIQKPNMVQVKKVVQKPPVIRTEIIKPAVVQKEIKKDIQKPTGFKTEIKRDLQKSNIVKNESEKEKKAQEMEETIDEEEFMDEDNTDLDEDEYEESGTENFKQRMMRPETMDEEAPSDDDSDCEDGSIYDELPSSESEDMDDWFTLDIRAETAAEYIPLLGDSAYSLLLEEKLRAEARVSTLQTSLTALTDSARRQAEALRSASLALAELDDTLRAV